MSNDLVLREAGLRQVTCIVRERQLRLFGHVARLPAENLAHRTLTFLSRVPFCVGTPIEASRR